LLHIFYKNDSLDPGAILLTQKVGIIGVGHAKFRKRIDATLRELAREAVTPAFGDARAKS